jgi:geranylgeranyl diphosphate synthase type II
LNFEQKLADYFKKIEGSLIERTNELGDVEEVLLDAVKHSLLSGGKYIRSIMFLSFYEIFGNVASPEIYRIACSIEMIHTYSLIHDDLPCMDDAGLRRGKLSCHAAYGENIALLVGDALLTRAFENIAVYGLDVSDAVKVLQIIKILSNAAGIEGMISGQAMDLNNINNANKPEDILKLYSKKTGMMFAAPCAMAAVLSGCREEEVLSARKFGESIGLTFQLIDDILDVTGNEKLIGKNPGNDEKNNKATYVVRYGLDVSIKLVEDTIAESKKVLSKINRNTAFLEDLADYLKGRIFTLKKTN